MLQFIRDLLYMKLPNANTLYKKNVIDKVG